MRAVFAVLTDLPEQLNTLNSAVVHNYDILGFVQLNGLRQARYNVGRETGDGLIKKVFVKKSKEKVLSEPSGTTHGIPINHATALLREAGVGLY